MFVEFPIDTLYPIDLVMASYGMKKDPKKADNKKGGVETDM